MSEARQAEPIEEIRRLEAEVRELRATLERFKRELQRL